MTQVMKALSPADIPEEPIIVARAGDALVDLLTIRDTQGLIEMHRDPSAEETARRGR